MVGIITQSSSLNSFSSICYCVIALGIHSYSSYKAVKREKDADSKAWPGGGGTPSEATLLLGSTIVSLLMLPFFCITCFLKIGNFANDGVKLGRDHALGYFMDASQDSNDKHENLKRIWRHFCPLSQTLHLVAAFLLLIPETLLTAVEVKFGYKSADAAWLSNLDFLYPPNRAMLSEIRSSVNVSHYTNSSYVVVPTPRMPTAGWNDSVTISMAFINFCFALSCFLIRYSSVFWYTNKPLTVIFAVQLLAMAMNSIFSFNSFSVLYCVCYNKKLYPNASLSLSCALDLVLYFSGSTILVLSTMTVFEYGSYYFHEKFKIVERHHHPESYVKQTVVFNVTCQGYVPHTCAMASLIVFAVCKGPLIYDLVSLMRVTDDQLILSGIVCEVFYMVMWVALWFGLTIKQQWQFRVLDYVALRQPLHLIPSENGIKHCHPGHGEAAANDCQNKGKRLSGRDFHGRFMEPTAPGTTSSSDEQYHSDIGTDESDLFNIINYAADGAFDQDSNPVSDNNSNFRRSRIRRNGGQRVTFDESVRSNGSTDKENQHASTTSITRQGTIGGPRVEEINHFNVTADVHNSTSSSTNSSNGSTQDVILIRHKSNNVDNMEYRNNIRSKCNEFYSSANNLSSNFEEVAIASNPPEPLPTLMCSFRDTVRESSIAANTFKDRERHMLDHFDYPDHIPPPIVDDLHHNESCKRQCIAISDQHMGEVNYRLEGPDTAYVIDNGINNDRFYRCDNSMNDTNKYRLPSNGDEIYDRPVSADFSYRFDDNVNAGEYKYDTNARSSSLSRHIQQTASGNIGDRHLSSFKNDISRSSEFDPPPVLETSQLRGISTGFEDGVSAGIDYNNPACHPPQNIMVGGSRLRPCIPLHPKIEEWHELVGGGKKNQTGRRDSANYSLTSSNESDKEHVPCTQV